MAVTQLGYLGFTVRDRDAWKRLATGIMGFEVIEEAEGGLLYLRFDGRHHRFALYPGATDALAYAGWEAPDRAEFAAILERARAAGTAVTAGTTAECAQHKVNELASFRDPEGFTVEIYHGAQRASSPFLPTRPVSGFKTGPLGLGHLVLRCGLPERAVKFYCDVLGLRITDTADLTHMSATFLHCNPRHHSLAITSAPGATAGTVSHVMVEAAALQDVGRAYELCQAEGVPIWLSLGQHTNDRLMSFYMRSPSGFGFEYGFGGVEVDDATWQVEHWKSGSFWGHKPA